MKTIKTTKPEFPPARILTGMSEGIYPCFGGTPYVRKVGISMDEIEKALMDSTILGTSILQVKRIDPQDFFNRQRLPPEVQTKLKDQVYVHPFLNTNTEE